MRDKTELLRIGLPLRMHKLRAVLDTLDDSDPETIVRVRNGSLIVEEPKPTLPEAGQENR